MDNRTSLMESALSLFHAKGYDAVGVQEIVDRAGLSKPTLYYYFKSKTGLLESLIKENFSPFLKRLEEEGQYRGDLKQTLVGVTKLYFLFAEENPEFYMFLFSLIYLGRENEAYRIVRPYMVRQHWLIFKIFNQAEGLLGNMQGRQHQFAAGFTGTIAQYILLYFEKTSDMKIELSKESAYQVMHQFMHGIFS